MTEQIWIVDDDASIRWVLEKALSAEGYQVTCHDNADAMLRLVDSDSTPPEVLITDIRMPGTDGLQALQGLHDRLPELPVIVMTAYSDLEAAVASYSTGAFDYLPKPFDLDEVKSRVRSALAQKTADTPHSEPGSVTGIIGAAPAMQEVFRAIGRLSHSSVTVLINGASGTGKERVANALHHNSPRAQQPFVALNMAAIPHELIETELFGHERGAFTGANNRRAGRFEQADGGTLFLDEIGDMPMTAQTRLLRILQEGEFYRVGGATPVRVDVRIIAATHQDLERLVGDNSFREDLFYRINVIRIHLPVLADRAQDIALLARHFLADSAEEMGVSTKILTPATLTHLEQLPWPGNVRQLENICRWLTVMVPGTQVHIEDLPAEIRTDAPGANHTNQHWSTHLARWAERELASGHQDLLAQALPELERTLLVAALKHTNGKRQQAAKKLGLGRNTLARKLNELGISEAEFDDT